jgi:peptide/nickel transport system ATP-binding protein
MTRAPEAAGEAGREAAAREVAAGEAREAAAGAVAAGAIAAGAVAASEAPAADRSVAPVLECRRLSVSYGGPQGRRVPAVIDLDLSIGRGQAHGLVGESGCGKSTVALAIMRYLGKSGRVDSGRILFEGRDLLAFGPHELRALRGGSIAMVYQEPMASLNPVMTAGEQLIEVPMAHAGVDRAEALRRARDMLDRVRMPDAARILGAYPHQLSGGQQQRIVIGMALLSNPRLLVLDEPTTALDVTVEADIVELVRRLSAELGTSMLYISHNLGLIRETCDRMTVMYAGEAVETGTAAGVFARMRHPYTRALFASLPVPGADKHMRALASIPGQVASPLHRPRGCGFGPRCAHFRDDACGVGPIAWRADDLGDGARCARPAEIGELHAPPASAPTPAPAPGPICLDVRGLSKRYGTVSANAGLDISVRRGETLGLVGESGCGKSTLARIVMGLAQADTGSIELDLRTGDGAAQPAPPPRERFNLARIPVQRRRRDTIRDLQMIFQNPFDTLNPSRTVGAQLARAIRKLGGERGVRRIRERVRELLDLVKLPPDIADRRPAQLSGGQKQRAAIARAFAGHAAVVVADEPVSALDVSVQAAVIELLIDIQRRERTALLFISHDLSLVRYLSDRIVVMYLGKIMEEGRTGDVFAPPYHPYTEALLAAVPLADGRFAKRKAALRAEMPSASSPPAGCRFSTRCSYRIEGTCEREPPPVQEFAPGHRIACHLPRQELAAMRPVFAPA